MVFLPEVDQYMYERMVAEAKNWAELPLQRTQLGTKSQITASMTDRDL
jgi:hypothetical protein